MKLFAISDLHLGYEINRRALSTVGDHLDDWLILGGDIGESDAHLEIAFEHLGRKFARLLWVPGNHELWTVADGGARGVARYEELVRVCRRHGVLTPEDPPVVWPGEGGPHILAPLFLLYDYSFRPDEVAARDALEWAESAGLRCADEDVLHADPYPDKAAWCRARCELSARRLEDATRSHALPTVLINHFPLKRRLAVLPRIPRFAIWCGSTITEDWHQRFRASVVVSGHLHIRRTDWIDGVRFEEVSLGYPRHWTPDRGMESYLRQILPGPPPPLISRS